MQNKERILIISILAVTAAAIIIPGIINNNNREKANKLGEIKIQEDIASDRDEFSGEIDGPTGGDFGRPYDYDISNGSVLTEYGVELGLCNGLHSAITECLRQNKRFTNISELVIDTETYSDNDSQTTFELTTPQFPDIRFLFVYNKSDMSTQCSLK